MYNSISLIDIKFSATGITETWLHNDNSDVDELTDYRSIHLTRPSKKGGVSIYIHKSYDYLEIPEINIITEYFLCIFIEVKTRSKKCKYKLIISVVYRPPNANITAFTNHTT